MTTDTPEGLAPLPVEYYLWLATIERDVRVRDLTASEVASLLTALKPEAVAEAVEMCAKIAETWDGPRCSASQPRGRIATAIRAAGSTKGLSNG